MAFLKIRRDGGKLPKFGNGCSRIDMQQRFPQVLTGVHPAGIATLYFAVFANRRNVVSFLNVSNPQILAGGIERGIQHEGLLELRNRSVDVMLIVQKVSHGEVRQRIIGFASNRLLKF
jgi:hypothetical protein